MKKSELSAMNFIYTRWFHEEKNPSEQLGWSGDEDQISRFSQFLKLQEMTGSFDASSMLDVGCGFGDLAEFFEEKNVKTFNYTGIDSNEEFIKRAKKKERRIFILGEFLSHHFDQDFDFAFASGIFNVNVFEDEERAYENLFAVVDKMLKLSKKGVAFNFLSQNSDDSFALTSDMIIYDTKRIVNYYSAKGYTVKSIIAGYDNFDSTVLVKKD